MSKREQPNSLASRLMRKLLDIMRRVSPSMRAVNTSALIVGVLLAAATMAIMQRVFVARSDNELINAAYHTCQGAADDLRNTSDFLTSQCRLYVSTGDYDHLENYLNELDILDNRGRAMESLHEHATSDEAVKALDKAREYSDELAETELYALRLAFEATSDEDPPDLLASVELAADDEAASAAMKRSKANDLVYGSDYAALKLKIHDQVHLCSTLLVDTLRDELDASNAHLALLITAMYATVVMLMLVVVFVVVSARFLLLWPISLHEAMIREDKPLIPGGARELRTLTDAYNDMYAQNHSRTESLTYEADHDALTGVLNRGAFEELLTEHKHDSALLLVDVDLFKHFNDDYGHDMGDAILIEVSATLYGLFRSSDYIFRIGGDEFAVIATGMGPELREVIVQKIKKVAAFLRDTSNGLPAVTISVGIAFGTYSCTDEDLFQRADKALYRTKQNGRDGYTFADEL